MGWMRHGEPEVRRLLQEAESVLSTGGTIPQACQKVGISEAMPSRDSRRGGKEDWTRRVKELEKENKRLKHLVGQLMLDNAFLKDSLEAKHRR